ncbi:hypothetical protein RIF29_00618 [Crotalaria pallida]|uniref:Uncharacterized protein n=1 Tax=Crotalaria pallida TaxID=3830 RepID=A0AAN9P7A6_CROPI
MENWATSGLSLVYLFQGVLSHKRPLAIIQVPKILGPSISIPGSLGPQLANDRYTAELVCWFAITVHNSSPQARVHLLNGPWVYSLCVRQTDTSVRIDEVRIS